MQQNVTFLSFPTILPKKIPIFCTGWSHTKPKYILIKCWDAKTDIFDIIEKNVIFCVLEMAALGATLMTVSITGFLKMLDNTAGNLTTDSSNKINKSESK